ncbi:putative transcriptional regulatory protein pdtaR [bacterium HR11]|nr:putative transcriptional regulatory protein pdtaR [bacterium HR11]
MPSDERLEVLGEIIKVFGAGLELKPLLNAIAAAVARLTGADSCLIYVMDPTSRELVLYGASSPHPRHIGRIKMKLGEGITGWVAERQSVVAIPARAYEDERFKFFHSLPEDRYEAFFSAPLVASNGQLLGVMNIQHAQPHEHTREETELLLALANMVARAIENARMYVEAKQRAKHLEALFRLARVVDNHRGVVDEALTFIGQMLEDILGVPTCRVLVYEPEKQRFQGPRGMRIRPSHPLFDRLLRSQGPFVYEDSVGVVPLRFGRQCVGAILAYADGGLDDSTLSLLGDLSTHVAAFLRTILLEAEVRRAREALEVRKVLERAKWVLIERRGMTEADAHRWLQQTAMQRRIPLRQVCEAVLIAEGLWQTEGDDVAQASRPPADAPAE